jgi:hypothetical protein
MSCNVFATVTQNCSGSGRSENSKYGQKTLQLSHMLTSLLFVYRVLSDIDSLEEEKRVIQKVQCLITPNCYAAVLILLCSCLEFRLCRRCITR